MNDPARLPPSSLPRPEGELETLERAWRAPRGWRVISAVNNSYIGAFYIATALLFFVLAGCVALVMRAQLALPQNDLVSADTYNQLFTMHGTVMMFLFAVPIVEALAVYLLPAMLGARDLPFPRLSAYAFWAYAIGGIAFFFTIFFGLAPDGGWFMYPPLTSRVYSPGLNADFWLLGIGFIEISAIAGAIELVVGILMTRPPGMSLMKMPLYAWAMLVTGLMIVFAFPAVIACTMLLELERAFDWPFFDPARGGDPLLWQHLFWFFGHPEVYIIFLPGAGLVSMMVPALAGTALVARRAIVYGMIGVGVVSFALWIHHMFATGLNTVALLVVSAASFLIAIPTGMQIFAWIATFWRGRIALNAPTLFLVGFFFIFVLGGLTGVMVAVLPFDWLVHDTYFVVAHFHYVLMGGMVFPVFAGFYFWAPLFNGHRLSERAGRWVFGLMFAGFNLAFFPMHVSGLMGMPRRVYTYGGELGWNTTNLLSTAGAFVFAAGVLVFAIDALRTLRKPKQGPGNPWNAASLEWLPQGSYALRSIPQVTSPDPLWDQPGLREQVESGQHWLPDAPFAGRSTLITSMVNARPQYLLRLPADGWMPVVAAVGTAGFFLLLTVKLVALAAAFGIVAIVAILRWLWGLEQPPPASQARVADHTWLPVGAVGRRSHSWWAMIVLVTVDLIIFGSFAFAHVHVSHLADVCPPPGAALPSVRWPLAAGALLTAGWALMAGASRGLRNALPQDQRGLRLMVALACVLTAASVVVWSAGHLQAGLNPTAEAWSATVAGLMAWQGFHIVVLMFMGVYTFARSYTGRLQPLARATLDNTRVMWHGVTAQGLLGMLLVQALPWLMR